jgi:hypothetical protein
MTRAYGLAAAVNPLAVACPKCTRAAGKPCAKRSKLSTWIGTSKRCHSERVSEAIKMKETTWPPQISSSALDAPQA